MQIDRSRFLLLTASIAGGACSSGSSTSTGANVVVAAPVVALGGPDEAASAAPRTASTGKTGVSSDDDALAALDRSSAASVEDGSLCDEGGTAPTGCATLRAPGPQCESFSDTRAMCGRLARGLRPHVAEKAVDCILANNGKQSICDFNLANQCGISAMHKASCIDSATQATCTALTSRCGNSLQMRDCQMLLSVVSARNRRNMISCMSEGCSIEYCMFDIE